MTDTLTENSARDATTDTLVRQIVADAADATGVDALDLPPLYDAVDPEALDALVEHASGDDGLRVEFSFAGCAVTVRGDGSVAVRVVDDDGVNAVASADESFAQNC